jgi:hypothetical protein
MAVEVFVLMGMLLEVNKSEKRPTDEALVVNGSVSQNEKKNSHPRTTL